MKIRGNTVGTTTPRPDWNQTNPKRADYIKNKPDIEGEMANLQEQVAGEMANLQEQVTGDMANMKSQIEETEAIAKGRATGYVFDTVDALDAWLSDSANTASLVLGDNLYIRATDVPDYWWDGAQKQILETQKVDLDEYVKNTDYANGATAGVVMVDMRYGSRVVNGILDICAANNSLIDGRAANKNSLYSAGQYSRHTIVPSNVDYAVKKALADNKLVDTENAWTEEEKTAARELLGAVGNTDYANKDRVGVVKVNSNYGIYAMADGTLYTLPASQDVINQKKSTYNPIVPLTLDYAVKNSLTTNTIALTDAEKAAACAWLGVDGLVGALKIMSVDSWTVDVKSGETSEPHTCSGTVVAVFATILTSHGHKVSAMWTPNTSGMIDQFYSGEPNGPMTYYTIVDIAGEHVTVTAVHRDNTYYMTALIV